MLVRLRRGANVVDLRLRAEDGRAEPLDELLGAPLVPVAREQDDDRAGVRQAVDLGRRRQGVEEHERVSGVVRVRAHFLIPPVGRTFGRPRRVQRRPGREARPKLLHLLRLLQTTSTLLPSGSRRTRRSSLVVMSRGSPARRCPSLRPPRRRRGRRRRSRGRRTSKAHVAHRRGIAPETPRSIPCRSPKPTTRRSRRRCE